MAIESVSTQFATHFISALINHLITQKANVEHELHQLGLDISMRFLELHNINRTLAIIPLLQKLTFEYLPLFYKSQRKIERIASKYEGNEINSIEFDVQNAETEFTYILTENTPLFSKFISVPKEFMGFCADSLMCGIIYGYLRGSGFKSKVVAHSASNMVNLSRVVYLIKLNKDDCNKAAQY